MNEPRSCMVGFRLTEAERRKLDQLARDGRMTLTDVISALIDAAETLLPPRVVGRSRHTTEQRNPYSAAHGG